MNLTVLGLGDQWEILSGHFDKISQQSILEASIPYGVVRQRRMTFHELGPLQRVAFFWQRCKHPTHILAYRAKLLHMPALLFKRPLREGFLPSQRASTQRQFSGLFH